MSDIVEDVYEMNIDEINDFDFPLDKLFRLEVLEKDIKFNLLIHFKSNTSKLFCTGTGAHEGRNKGNLTTPLYFSRWSWHETMDESFIVYTDPIFYLDDEVRIGWYIGDENQWYLETISNIISRLMENQNINNEDVLFYGSSGGGFASLCLGALIKGSKVIVNNAQFFVLNYYPRFVAAAVKVLFGEKEVQEAYNEYPHRFDVIELYKKENYMPEIDYYVNSKSEADVNNHAIPFINKIFELDCFEEKLNIYFYQSDNGHNPLSNEETISIIKSHFINESPDSLKESKDKLKNENKKLKKENKKLKNNIQHFKTTKAYKTWKKYSKIKKDLPF